MKKLAIIGNYAPRCCGIATFTQDLRTSVMNAQPDLEAPVVMVSDNPQGYSYPEEVKVVLDERTRSDYRRVAQEINRSGAEVVSLQHEFGIFGGPDGEWLIDLLKDLRVPVVTTCHTVLKTPSPGQKRTLQEIARLSSKMVVMAEKGREFLRDVFEVPNDKIVTIDHGIPDLRVSDAERTELRRTLGWENRRVLLTFGLLSPNKGVEYAVRALPRMVEEHPEALYVVVGATHPNLVKEQGESYREHLVALAEELGVSRNLQFVNRFVARDELVRLIAASDIYLTPYLNEAQITSGTLAFAFGLGKPVISTPYWHATELLANNAGILVPFRDTAALADAALHLLNNDNERERMAAQAYERGHGMSWSEVGKIYHAVLEKASREVPVRRHSTIAPVPAPEVVRLEFPERFLQLERMTGEFGIFQHSKMLEPDPAHGFCTDDNARAAIFLMEAADLGVDVTTPRLSQLWNSSVSMMCDAWNPSNGRFRNFMDVNGKWLEPSGSEDSHGRALWSLGTIIAGHPDRATVEKLGRLFSDACAVVRQYTSPRTWAFVLLGLAKYRTIFPSDAAAANLQKEMGARLVDIFRRTAGPGWEWFENSVTYDNAKIPQALLATYAQTRQPELKRVGLASLEFLVAGQTVAAGYFRPIGCHGFWQRGGVPAIYDQQPLEVQATVAACLEAEQATGDVRWWNAAKNIHSWFHGRNDHRLPVAIAETGGCYDGLMERGFNLNQGAESILAYLQSTADMIRAHRRHRVPVSAGGVKVQTLPANVSHGSAIIKPGHAAA
ncbi:MAG: glycosyl transferase group 1 [Verrucomicrobiales bacterium]|nr:glycosyl transferase group 1 [Verrucomicrobiales bacterium]